MIQQELLFYAMSSCVNNAIKHNKCTFLWHLQINWVKFAAIRGETQEFAAMAQIREFRDGRERI